MTDREAAQRVEQVANGAPANAVYGGESFMDPAIAFRNDLRQIIAMVGGGEADGWRPIESAPDREWVLVYGGEQRALIVGPEAIARRVDQLWEDTHAYTLRPTHWRPLPPPPGPVGLGKDSSLEK